MRKYLVTLCACALVAAATAGAIGLPGGGGKVDTKKFDELIAKMDGVSAEFEEAKGKIDGAGTTLAAIAEGHGIADLMGDPAKIAELKAAVTDEDKAKLQEHVAALETIPDNLNAVVEKTTQLITEIPDALTDLANQITKNPLAAKDLTSKKDKLMEGKTALENIGAEVPALVESATNLSTTIAGLM
jgi:uncharacterized coiled-coil DUF342 family protein